jgi:hypothetical protein
MALLLGWGSDWNPTLYFEEGSTMKPSKRKVSAKVFEKAFDQGKDVSDYLDLRTAKVRKRRKVRI